MENWFNKTVSEVEKELETDTKTGFRLKLTQTPVA